VARGGVATDCAAIPGRDSWLIVQCQNDEVRRVWTVTAAGRILEMEAEA